jgi:hypothetical protein
MLSDDEIVEAMARGMFGDLHWTEQSRQTAQAALAAQRAMGLVCVSLNDLQAIADGRAGIKKARAMLAARKALPEDFMNGGGK